MKTNDAESIFSVFDMRRFLLPSDEERALLDSLRGPLMAIRLQLPPVAGEWTGRVESLVCTMLNGDDDDDDESLSRIDADADTVMQYLSQE